MPPWRSAAPCAGSRPQDRELPVSRLLTGDGIAYAGARPQCLGKGFPSFCVFVAVIPSDSWSVRVTVVQTLRLTLFRERSWGTLTPKAKSFAFFSLPFTFKCIENKSPERNCYFNTAAEDLCFIGKISLAMGEYCSLCKDLKID